MDEDRLRRLTDLARKIWSKDACHIYGYDRSRAHPYGSVAPGQSGWHVMMLAGGATYIALDVHHDDQALALDALEAALLVLSGQTPLVSKGQGALLKLSSRWIEQLADKWDAKAMDPAYDGHIRNTLRSCALELRAQHS